MNTIINVTNAFPLAFALAVGETVVLPAVVGFGIRVYVALKFLKQYEDTYRRRHGSR